MKKKQLSFICALVLGCIALPGMASGEADTIEEIVVTGSRIARDEFLT